MAEGTDDAEVPIMTTLHYVIETQRMGTITETTGRSASFLQSTSMALVALGFTAPATKFGPAFVAFATGLMIVLIALGVLTFFRCVQLGIADGSLAMQAETVRRFYLAKAPPLDRFMPPLRSPDDAVGMAVGAKWPGQTLLTNAAIIAFVVAALAASVAVLTAYFVIAASLTLTGVAATVVFGTTLSVLLGIQRVLWKRARDQSSR